jgi:hypothetical protein
MDSGSLSFYDVFGLLVVERLYGSSIAFYSRKTIRISAFTVEIER